MPKDKPVADTATGVAPTIVQPVVKAVGILRHLGAIGTPATVTNISRALKINTSTCFNILRTLVAEGLLVFDDDTKTYRLGLGVVQIAQRALSENGTTEVLRPLLADTARRHGVTGTLWRCGEKDRHLVASASESNSAFRIQMQIGHQAPLYVGALGRSLAALLELDDAALREIYDLNKWARPPGFDGFRAQVAQARQAGWAMDDGAYAAGVTNLAVAIPGSNGTVHFGVVMSLFQGQLAPDQIDALGADMVELAEKIAGLD